MQYDYCTCTHCDVGAETVYCTAMGHPIVAVPIDIDHTDNLVLHIIKNNVVVTMSYMTTVLLQFYQKK